MDQSMDFSNNRPAFLDSKMLGIMVLTFLVGVGFAVRREYRDYQGRKAQAQHDATTDAMLIEKKENVTAQGYTGIMFFDTDNQPRTVEAIAHYVTTNPNQIMAIRRTMPGSIKRISVWRALLGNWQELQKD